MQRSNDINELATALAKAQGQMKDAKKENENPFFRSRYADLASVWEACRKALSDNGLAVVQTIEVKDGKRILESTLLHTSGQWISSLLDLLPKEETAQALGSAITYARRYALSALVGVSPDDDDGEGAMARPGISKPPTESKDTAPKPAAPVASKPTSETPALDPLTVFGGVADLYNAKTWSQDFIERTLAELGAKGTGTKERVKSLSQENLQQLKIKVDSAMKRTPPAAPEKTVDPDDIPY